MMTIYYYKKETCFWSPLGLARKIDSLIDDKILDGGSVFVRFEEIVPSEDGKTVHESYVRGGMCMLSFIDADYIKGNALTLRHLSAILKMEHLNGHCKDDEGIAGIYLGDGELKSVMGFEEASKRVKFVRLGNLTEKDS